MAAFSAWLNKLCCCRCDRKQPYIYLYSPSMGGPSSSSSHCCLVCILFGLCLIFVVILAAVVIYHLNSSDFIFSHHTSTAQNRIHPIAKKRQLPDFVNTDKDPCEHFYEFVCDKWTRRKKFETYDNENEIEQRWYRIRQELHGKFMVNLTSQTISNDIEPASSSTYRLYQLCETQSSASLLYEFDRYFDNLIQQEPYRSHLTLFNRSINSKSEANIALILKPFLTIDNNNVIRITRRPLPPPLNVFTNISILNQTALKHLTKFDDLLTNLLREERDLIKPDEQAYNQDALIVQRILTFSDYHLCLPLGANASYGRQGLIELLDRFLRERLQHMNTNLIDQQIRILDKITDNHTFIAHLTGIRAELQAIDEAVSYSNENNSSCMMYILDTLLDKRMKIVELKSIINFYSNQTTNLFFTSNDWPFFAMLFDRLLKRTPQSTLINFAFFDTYRHLIYPYYQPHLSRTIDINFDHRNEQYGFTYQTKYPTTQCRVNSCFDIFHCYHPSLLNQIIDHDNQTLKDLTKKLVQDLIIRLRMLAEQSELLNDGEKNLINNEFTHMQIAIGHYIPPKNLNTSLINSSASYLDLVQLFSSIEYDREERSYYIEPIYFPLNHTLFIPYGFLHLIDSENQQSIIEYNTIQILIEIIRNLINLNPFRIECLIKSQEHNDDDYDNNNNHNKIDHNLTKNDEYIVYLLYRSKFLQDQKIILDEYLWPFMSANGLMKRFLIDYTAKHYCNINNGYKLLVNNTYLIDDVHLVFNCKQASWIRQSKCTIT